MNGNSVWLKALVVLNIVTGSVGTFLLLWTLWEFVPDIRMKVQPEVSAQVLKRAIEKSQMTDGERELAIRAVNGLLARDNALMASRARLLNLSFYGFLAVTVAGLIGIIAAANAHSRLR